MNYLLLVRRGTLVLMLATLTGCSDKPLDGQLVAEQKGCVACHGLDGKAIAPSYPNLEGQWSRYLRVQLKAYRDGGRENGVMNGMAATLTNNEIHALAEYYGD